MITFTRPAIDSMWRDPVDNLACTVLGIDGQGVLVRCSNGVRCWNDEMHLSLFGTELQEVK